MAITFGGLATGMDTTSLIEQLMAAERQPLDAMERDKSYFNARSAALSQFEGKLEGFLSKIENLDSEEMLQAKKGTLTEMDFFGAKIESDAVPGNYQVEVLDLAQVQKSVSLGVTDKTAASFGIGSLTLTVGDNDPLAITVDADNNSLEGLMASINEADAGVTASIINDGTDTPYRLVLTGADIATGFSLSSDLPSYNGDVTSLTVGGYTDQYAKQFGSGTLSLSTGHDITLGGESNSLDDIRTAINAETGTTGVSATVEDDGNGGFRLELVGGSITSTALTGGTGFEAPSVTTTQTAKQAHIIVDGIDIYSDSNTLDEAIPGVTLDLTKAEADTVTSLNIQLDEDAIKNQIKSFVSGYNEIISFVTSQSKTEGSDAGILSGDSGVNSIKRRLQNLMTTPITGSISSMSQLGLQTQRDGSLKIDDAILTEAIQDDLSGVTSLLAGDDSTEGIASRFKSYLDNITDDVDGLFAGRKEGIKNTVKRIDTSIERMETRLEKREVTLTNQFNVLEQLVSVMNSQSDYLGRQMSAMEDMWSYNR
ncbi:MAG: flagellar filament capping protein FliD [Desulfuromonadaceae bacterium]|nr:flagellar filament capping protein FliD [Desulfuromonadaceae bacterium]